MPRRSAGILVYRLTGDDLEVFIVHPGGPFWARRDEGCWSLPKGEIEAGEPPREVARREFEEETGRPLEACTGDSPWLELGEVTQRGGKRVVAWAARGDWPAGLAVRSNEIPIEWPPRTGRVIRIPEIDQGRFFSVGAARRKLNPAQVPFLDRLLAALPDAVERSG